MRSPTPKAFILLVKDHVDHNVGCSDVSLDISARVQWAWEAAQQTVWCTSGAVGSLVLDVRAGTVNGSRRCEHASMLREAHAAADKLLPLLAKAWDSAAPETLVDNVAEKLGHYDTIKHLRAVCEEENPDGSRGASVDVTTVQEACSLPMKSLDGAKRASLAMIVSAVFAAELSQREQVPVFVVGRPPGHHATCAHCLNLEASPHPSPGGPLEGRGMGGGCFYPSCWVAAVHCLRQGFAKKLAYLDIDAHKPDGIWKEVERLRALPKARRAKLLGRSDADCQGVYFASVHVDGYPNPGGSQWKSAQCTLPKTAGKAFEVQVLEELLQGVDELGSTPNSEMLARYERWKKAAVAGLNKFQPTGIFVGLGFDLHKAEGRINDKRMGIGIGREHYCDFLSSLSSCSAYGPVVLTLEGGYTKSAVKDGIRGALAGMVALSQARRPRKRLWKKTRPSLAASIQKKRLSTPQHVGEGATVGGSTRKRMREKTVTSVLVAPCSAPDKRRRVPTAAELGA